jgi:hypothetical protein
MVRIEFRRSENKRPSYLKITQDQLDRARLAFLQGSPFDVIDVDKNGHTFAAESIKAITDKTYDPLHI